MKPDYYRQILALTDLELERFVREWVDKKKGYYYDVARFSGTGDMGRDVVGFMSDKLHEGDWDNYQCKQYGKAIGIPVALLEIGKILYYASRGNFTIPKAYLFVAPKGVARALDLLIFKPSEFKKKLISEWDDGCAKNISKGSIITIDERLMEAIEKFNFANVKKVGLDEILLDAAVSPVLFRWFGADPGKPPSGVVPENIESAEIRYIGKLLDAYSVRDGQLYRDYQSVKERSSHGRHISAQRERFYDADAFKRYYRDSTDAETLDDLERDVMHGVLDVCSAEYRDPLSRVDAVMAQAASVQPSGPLAKYARVTVRQGLCHHFANEDKLEWKF